jgi:small subunit ribosomal protein S26e
MNPATITLKERAPLGVFSYEDYSVLCPLFTESRSYLPTIGLKSNRGVVRQFKLTKKRKSRGRSKGGKGRSSTIYCSNCGSAVPRDKAKKVTTRMSLVEPTLARELRAAGAYIASPTTVRYYCISCAVHYGIVKVRAQSERHGW